MHLVYSIKYIRILNCFLLDDVDGYVEDGREIFDDDLDEASIVKEEKKGRGKKRSRADKSFDEDHSSSNKDIQKMFKNIPKKKKKEVHIFNIFNLSIEYVSNVKPD